MKNWVISDIHGCSHTFEALLNTIGLNKDDSLFLLGDYIDRGPKSKQVIDRVMRLQEENYNIRCLIGNHEIMMLYTMEHPRSLPAYDWRNLHGGRNTLKSFEAATVNEVDQKYIDFIRNLSFYIEKDNFILVHAGLNLNIGNPFSDEDVMVWSESSTQITATPWLGKRIIVHGHTIRPRRQIIQSINQLDQFPILGIDNGCVYPYHEYNHLCAIELNDRKVFFQKNIDV